MNTKPPSRQYYLREHDIDKAVPSSSTYQPGQLDEYLAETKENEGKHSHVDDQHHHHNRLGPHPHSQTDEEMSTARSSRGQDDGAGALPVEMKPRSGADTKPRSENRRNDPIVRAQVAKNDIDMEENKAVARHPVAASYPGAVTTAGKEKSFGYTEPNKATRSLGSNLDNSFGTKTSALGVAALASTSMSCSAGTARAYNTHGLNSIEEENSKEKPNIRVGAVVVPGLSSSGQTSDHSASTYSEINYEDSLSSPAAGKEQPLQAMLVADRVTWDNEDADVEAQMKARMRTEAEDIADMVHRRIFQNTATAVVDTGEAKSTRRKKICILLVAVLVIAGAVGAGVGIALSKPPPPPPPEPTSPPPSDSIEIFRNALDSVSGERLDDENSPQYKALRWIANDDPAETSVGVNDIESIKQRYVAAVLYFALGGDNWIEKYNFLTGDPICSWNQESSGVICDSTNVRVVTLHLCKSNRLDYMTMSTIMNALTSKRLVLSPNSSKEWSQWVDPRRDWIFLQPEHHQYYGRGSHRHTAQLPRGAHPSSKAELDRLRACGDHSRCPIHS
jgi:hypothetical protein